MSDAQIIPAFPTPIYRAIVGPEMQRNAEFEAAIDAMKARDVAGATDPKLKALYEWEEYTSFFTDQHIYRHEWFAPLKAAFERHVQAFLQQLSVELGERRLEMQTAFANIMTEPFHHHGRHIHTGSVLSGVYYVRTASDTGQITFEHPAADHFMQDLSYREKSILNVSTISIAPQPGELLIFPSHLPHKVEQSHSSAKRVAISFNMGLAG